MKLVLSFQVLGAALVLARPQIINREQEDNVDFLNRMYAPPADIALEQRLDPECTDREAGADPDSIVACQNPIDWSPLQMLTAAQYNNSTPAAGRTHVAKNAEPGVQAPAGVEYLSWTHGKDCNFMFKQGNGDVCFAYDIEIASTGQVRFTTEVWADTTLHTPKYGIACGLRDGEGRAYSLARSGKLYGKLLIGSENRGRYQKREDIGLSDKVEMYWEDIKAAAVPQLGPDWGHKPLLVCFPLIKSTTESTREGFKYASQVRLEKWWQELGRVTEYVDLFQ